MSPSKYHTLIDTNFIQIIKNIPFYFLMYDKGTVAYVEGDNIVYGHRIATCHW